MANWYTVENQNKAATPPLPAGNEAYNGRERCWRATIALDAPITSPGVTGTQIASGDTITLFDIPPGFRFLSGSITSTVSLSTSTVAIGNSASAGKYRAAAVFTATDTPTGFGIATVMAAPAATGPETIILTVGTAALPNTAGAKLIIDMRFAGP